MEELTSTETLDREILEDARKKAFKILKNADDSIGSSKLGWDKKIEKARNKTGKNYADKEEQMRREITARFPMDKRRIRSEAIDKFLSGAMENFLGSLDHAFMLRILKKELENIKNQIPFNLAGEGEIRYRFLSKEECNALVSDYFKGITFRFIEDSLYMIAGKFPALVIDFPSLRIIVSVDRAAEALLSEKRAELTLALLGEIEDLTLASSVEANENG
jgi:hypothetical protein